MHVFLGIYKGLAFEILLLYAVFNVGILPTERSSYKANDKRRLDLVVGPGSTREHVAGTTMAASLVNAVFMLTGERPEFLGYATSYTVDDDSAVYDVDRCLCEAGRARLERIELGLGEEAQEDLD